MGCVGAGAGGRPEDHRAGGAAVGRRGVVWRGRGGGGVVQLWPPEPIMSASDCLSSLSRLLELGGHSHPVARVSACTSQTAMLQKHVVFPLKGSGYMFLPNFVKLKCTIILSAGTGSRGSRDQNQTGHGCNCSENGLEETKNFEKHNKTQHFEKNTLSPPKTIQQHPKMDNLGLKNGPKHGPGESVANTEQQGIWGRKGSPMAYLDWQTKNVSSRDIFQSQNWGVG